MALQRRVVEAEPTGHALAEVLHEDIRLLDETIDDLARLGLLQVDGEAAFVAVVGLEIEVRAIAEIDAAQFGHAAAGIAADAFFNFDHVGTEIAEHRRADRSLLPDGPIDDSYPVERHRHEFLRFAATLRRGRRVDKRSPAGRGLVSWCLDGETV